MKTPNNIALRRFGNDIYARAVQDAESTVGMVLFTDPVSGNKGVLHSVSGDKVEAGKAMIQLALEILKAEGVDLATPAPPSAEPGAVAAAE